MLLKEREVKLQKKFNMDQGYLRAKGVEGFCGGVGGEEDGKEEGEMGGISISALIAALSVVIGLIVVLWFFKPKRTKEQAIDKKSKGVVQEL